MAAEGLLALDVGNRRAKARRLPLVDDGHGFAASCEDAASLVHQLKAHFGTFAGLEVVCVRPEIAQELARIAEQDGFSLRLWTTRTLAIEHPYDDPDRLGADRLLAVWTTRALFHAPAIVVDAGTAMTVDGLDARGRFVGGAIAPGLPLIRGALGRGAMLHAPTTDTEPSFPGRDTDAAISLGLFAAFYGAIDHLVAAAEAHLGQDAAIVVTGGDGPLVKSHLDPRPLIHEPDLLFRGLELLSRTAS